MKRLNLEGFVEVEPAPVRAIEQQLHISPAMPIAAELVRRLDNWRSTVLGKASSSAQACAFWANSYIKARNERERALAIELEIIKPESKLGRVADDDLDGWLVEAAVRTLMDHDERQLLRLIYVYQFRDHWVMSKLGIRRKRFMIVHAKALQNLRNLLVRLNQPAKIRANNLNAGNPRLEAPPADPMGVVSPEFLKTFTELTDDASVGRRVTADSNRRTDPALADD